MPGAGQGGCLSLPLLLVLTIVPGSHKEDVPVPPKEYPRGVGGLTDKGSDGGEGLCGAPWQQHSVVILRADAVVRAHRLTVTQGSHHVHL